MRQGPGDSDARRRPVTIPWRDTISLRGDYLPFTGDATARAPAVICVAEQDGGYQPMLALMARRAHDRGMALLGVDLASDAAREALIRSRRPETCITAMIDWLAERPEIDPARIAVVGDGSASSLLAKGVAMDGRVAAAVCDGGVWELWEHAHSGIGGGSLGAIAQPPNPPLIRCPLLIALRPGEGIDPFYAERLLAAHAPDRAFAIVTFEVPDASSPAGEHRAGLAADAVLDWVSRQLQGVTAPHREAGADAISKPASD